MTDSNKNNLSGKEQKQQKEIVPKSISQTETGKKNSSNPTKYGDWQVKGRTIDF